MQDRYSRADFLRRAAAGGTVLTVPGLLAACGGGKSAATTTAAAAKALPKTIVFSNWPLYIDINKAKQHPSIQQFDKKYKVNVNYIEDINDNDTFYGKIEGPCRRASRSGATSSCSPTRRVCRRA